MRELAALVKIAVAIVLLVLFAAVAIKLLWFGTSMGMWTGLGEIPWGPAIFLGILFSGSGASRLSGK